MYFELQADDLDRAATFYRELFGWQIDRTEEDIPVEYRRVHSDELAGGLVKRTAPAPEPGQGTNAFVCSFEVPEFDKATTRIGELGGSVALPKFPVPGRCWQGYFVDPEGNTFGVFEVDESAR